jgi:hypothetical protein|nr:MAG TPA: hypothetical protein [Inoviridae sp.]
MFVEFEGENIEVNEPVESQPSNDVSADTLNFYINQCNIGMFILLAVGFVGGCLIGSKFIGGLWNK